MTGWIERVAAARADGWTVLDLLAVVDRGAQREIVVRLLNAGSGEARTLVEVAEGDRIPSLTPALPAAAWYEREAAEMSGVVFVGHPDARPLLLTGDEESPPLRRTTPLLRRQEQPWPGEHDPAGGRVRRPVVPPGVLGEWVT
jgi:NADH-quinone oxidoreductase subunit C